MGNRAKPRFERYLYLLCPDCEAKWFHGWNGPPAGLESETARIVCPRCCNLVQASSGVWRTPPWLTDSEASNDV